MITYPYKFLPSHVTVAKVRIKRKSLIESLYEEGLRLGEKETVRAAGRRSSTVPCYHWCCTRCSGSIPLTCPRGVRPEEGVGIYTGGMG